MLAIGVTGGIGCGKSAVTDYLADKGITIADADQAARLVVAPGQPALQAIVARFGEHLLAEDGSLDRRVLRDIVFADADERVWLEQLTHPLIIAQLQKELAQASSPYAILVAPLLIEAKLAAVVDRVLVVDVDPAVQIARTMARDSASRAHIEAIIKAQASREQRLAIADDVVHNNGSLAELYGQLDALHALYLSLAAFASC